MTTTRLRTTPFRPGLWLLAPAALFGAFVLACGAGSECDPLTQDCAPPLGPAQRAQLDKGRSALLGTWTVQQHLTARDDVERPLDAGVTTWELEIFHVELFSVTADTPLVSWEGALSARELCLVGHDNFTPDGGACETLAPAQFGSCSSHACKQQNEIPVSGTYDVDEDKLNFEGSVRIRAYFHDPDEGYINHASYLDQDLYLAQGANPAPCQPGFTCSWSSNVEGPIADAYPTLRSDIEGALATTLLRDTTDHRDDRDAVDSEEVTVPIGARERVEEILLGTGWVARLHLGALDAVERPVTIGDAQFDIEIFEIEEGGLVGQWTFKGAARAKSLCLTSTANVDNATYTCDTFSPAQMGTCSNADCTEEGEVPITGRYNELTGLLTLDDARVKLFYLDPAQGFLYVTSYLVTEDAELINQTIEPTVCTAGFYCSWSVNTTGAFEEQYPEGWEDVELLFEMSR